MPKESAKSTGATSAFNKLASEKTKASGGTTVPFTKSASDKPKATDATSSAFTKLASDKPKQGKTLYSVPPSAKDGSATPQAQPVAPPLARTSMEAAPSTYRKYHRRHVPRSKSQERTKLRIVPVRDDREGSSGSDPGSDVLVDYHSRKRRRSRTADELDTPSGPSSTSSSTESPLSSADSIESSINRFRDDFDSFKCKMRIFGESLQLCKCIAHDFMGKLSYMERKLHFLEKRQKHNKTHNNYSAIIRKNKQLSTKTKEYVQKLQKCGTEEEMREVAGRICRNYLPGIWKLVEPQDLQCSKITGGLSNFIYLVGLPEDPTPLYKRLHAAEDEDTKAIRDSIDNTDVPTKVLLRIYGQVHGERAMDAIVTESVIFTLLSERRLGPRLYGVFSGGRIEEYIPARSLTTRELSEPAISMKIAEKTAAIHSMEIPLSKEGNYIWKTMGKWLKTINDEVFSNGIKGKNEKEQACIARLKQVDFAAEIEWLKKFLAAFESPIVFCHNDLQEGNILYLEDTHPQNTDEYDAEFEQLRTLRSVSLTKQHTESCQSQEATCPTQKPEDLFPDSKDHAASRAAFLKNAAYNNAFESALDSNLEDTTDSVMSHISDTGEPKLYLIDFEYCAYNYRAFDIANHFAEWVYDYTNPEFPFYYEYMEYWPTLEQKEIFIKEYLKHYTVLTSDSTEPTEPHIDAVNKLLAEVDAFALACPLFWTLWSIVNASKSQIPFGYWEYGISRLETYFRLKQEVIKKDKYGLPQKRKIEEVDI